MVWCQNSNISMFVMGNKLDMVSCGSRESSRYNHWLTSWNRCYFFHMFFGSFCRIFIKIYHDISCLLMDVGLRCIYFILFLSINSWDFAIICQYYSLNSLYISKSKEWFLCNFVDITSWPKLHGLYVVWGNFGSC